MNEATRIVVVGHVDHGKSTLIGRLLYDAGALHPSKVEEVMRSSARRGLAPEWSYVLDSLQEERDQAVTIDTTRLWFVHAGRRYVIIDAPGHPQFLANMITGASEAETAILIVDAERGVEEQTVRHAYLLGFLGIRHVIVALNKIDLLADAAARVAELERAVEGILHVAPGAVIPLSASTGENVALRGGTTAWYRGPTMLEALERVPFPAQRGARPLRLAIQDVYRRDRERIAVGTISSGSVEPGTTLRVLPSHESVRVQRLVRWPEAPVRCAADGETIGVVLEGERFVSRGDTLADPADSPTVARDVAADVFWLDPEPPIAGEWLRVRRGTQDLSAAVSGEPAIVAVGGAAGGRAQAQYNIARLSLHAAAPLVFDRRDDDAVGARTVILRGSRVVAIGFLVDVLAVVRRGEPVSHAERERRSGHRPAIVWLTGLPGAGKSTLARVAERALFDLGCTVAVVDGDTLRGTLNVDLGFSREDRAESVRRAGAVAEILSDKGHIVIVALVSPYAAERERVRGAVRHPFYEVYVNASLETCEQRDPKGLYRRARAKTIPNVTGIDAPYEAPSHADLELHTDAASVEESAEHLVRFIRERVSLTVPAQALTARTTAG